MDYNKVAADEARRAALHGSMKSQVEREVNEEIAERAERATTTELQRMEEVAGRLRGKAIEQVVRTDRTVIRERGLALSSVLTPQPVRTDPARVRQVLTNLLSNAIKYTPAGGRIEVMTDMPARRDPGDGARLAIHVADNGPGIPADKYEEVFGEFTRLSNGDKPGAGLGLSIARRVARLLGGDITVSARNGGGARFTLWLPTSKGD